MSGHKAVDVAGPPVDVLTGQCQPRQAYVANI